MKIPRISDLRVNLWELARTVAIFGTLVILIINAVTDRQRILQNLDKQLQYQRYLDRWLFTHFPKDYVPYPMDDGRTPQADLYNKASSDLAY